MITENVRPMRKCMLILIMLAALGSYGQERPMACSLELEFQKAVFDPSWGLALKANQGWHQGEKYTFYSSLLLGGYLAPGTSPATQGTLRETDASFRMQTHLGSTRRWGAQKRFYSSAELFVGLRLHRISGELQQPSQGFTREVTETTWLLDFGPRLVLGYDLGERLALQLSLTNSWRQLNNPLGPHVGLFFWGPDVLAYGGIGLRYRL